MEKINNIGRLFYKDYYEGLEYGYVFDGNKTKLKNGVNGRIKSSALVRIENPACQDVLPATVLYPGLVTGTGLVHDSKNIEGGYNLGMHFDYTWGMPVIYGSSVKGVLRQYFEEFCLEEVEKGREGDVRPLCKAIFEGGDRSIYERDIFFDAVITEGCNGRILDDDSITPHTEGPLKNPVPITMLKIAPGCKIEFRFRLHDSVIGENEYSVDFKKRLFKKILGTVGVGAKTNVGYGQLKFD